MPFTRSMILQSIIILYNHLIILTQRSYGEPSKKHKTTFERSVSFNAHLNAQKHKPSVELQQETGTAFITVTTPMQNNGLCIFEEIGNFILSKYGSIIC